MTTEKEYVELVQNSLSQLDKYQKNAEMIIANFNQLINEGTKGTKHSRELKYSEEEKLKAAYSLNLCTVSVSQIVDYNDVLILEQEYEMILNNLNLENIPKDEALLSILKQLLDTITFFRIQEGDKKSVEKEYQYKMRNAVWAAVPNFGLIVAGGNPITMAVSLASQVGIGYMNYRRTKAENNLEQDRQMWQLQRSAIEQFNGLRRELFDTAWRLADEYNFPDEYRLTEKQISQYNTILMDANPIRRYERLESIKHKFIAYVPFWYHFGNTANQIAQDVLLSEEVRNRYRINAVNHFENFKELNDKNLLREDQIASACALEYIDLLDVEKDKDKIKELIDIAVNNAGGFCDVLQLCAIAFLKIKKLGSAKNILIQLVNEDYNTILNAQILSYIYASDYFNGRDQNTALADYEILGTRVEREYLFPLPKDGTDDFKRLNSDFLKAQRKVLRTKYCIALNMFIKKYTIKYNRIFPTPNISKEYDDAYFLDSETARTKRLEDLKIVWSNPRKKLEFCDRLKDEMIVYNLFEVINEMYDAVNNLGIVTDYQKLEDILACDIEKNKNSIYKIIDNASNNMIDEISTDMLTTLTFYDLVFMFFKELYRQLMDYVEKSADMDEIVRAEFKLVGFCTSQGLPNPEKIYRERTMHNAKSTHKKIFSPGLLGLQFERLEREKELKSKCNVIVEHYKDRLFNSDKMALLLETSNEFGEYFDSKNANIASEWKRDTVAVIDAKGPFDLEIDLLLTVKGVVAIKQNSVIARVHYRDFEFRKETLEGKVYSTQNTNALIPNFRAEKKQNDKIKITEFKYSNKNVKMLELYALIGALKREMPSEYEENRLCGKDVYDFLNIEELPPVSGSLYLPASVQQHDLILPKKKNGGWSKIKPEA